MEQLQEGGIHMISNNKRLINNNWWFKQKEDKEYNEVNLPHTNVELPYNYFDEKSYQIITHYKRYIYIENKEKRVFMQFDGVMTAFKFYVNDKFVGEYKGGYTPKFIEITNLVNYGEKNSIYLEVDSSEREDIPPFGHVIDYLTYGGVYRDVYLYEVSQCFIENAFYDYKVSDIKNGHVELTPKVLIDNKGEAGEYLLNFTLKHKDNSEEEIKVSQSIKVEKASKWYELEEIALENIKLWDIENPNLYEIKLELFLVKKAKESCNLDESTEVLGFRHLKVEENGVYINGNKVKIRGLNRHQAFPYAGYAMPARAQRKDAEILKFELGLNTVRSSHYPASPHFLNRCDEIGLLVLEEIPGWQHVSSDEAWRNQALDDVQCMILRDFNHPSIITWGVRINESGDDDELYTKANDLARRLDASRPTSGIRCYENSHLLEDIYTMNDFIHEGGEQVLRTRKQVTGLDKKVPYLVTEFCGHIFPTKRFDNEERLVEHALRHGRVQSASAKSSEHLGAIGWCAFDYNTHFDFGSGDRICYHGVMDMFRIPKLASYIYSSQKEPSQGVVLEPLTYWTRGERNKGEVFPIYICTNCDSVEVVLEGKTVGIFRRDENTLDNKLSGLKYPPIKIEASSGEWGYSWNEVEFKGFLDNKQVAVKKYSKNPVLNDLSVTIDDKCLKGEEVDTTRVVVKAVDQCENLLPFISGFISVETEGDISVVGPKQVALIGGCIGFWIKTKGKLSNKTAKINIKSSFGIEKTLEVELVK